MCRPVHQEIELKAKPKDVYEAYMDSRRHAAFTGSPARMSRRIGGKFTAGGDYIVGYNLDLVPNQRIVQAWRATEWEDGAYSVLTLRLIPSKGGTRLVLDHVGVPEEHRSGIDSGWTEFYWEPLRTALARPGRAK